MSWCGLIAGALAVLYGVIGVLFAVAGGIELAGELAGADSLDPVGAVVFLALVVVAAVLLAGGALLLARRASGRWTVAGGAVLSIGGIAYVLLRTSSAPMGVTPELAATGNTEVRHIAVIALVLAVVMLALALVPQRQGMYQGSQPSRG
ncbi:MAG: hypothetical protein GEU97_16230 [Actinophytocola sp.]|nr:hypothetical protein [Actinophytocola sp.]